MASVNKQEACFARATQVNRSINYSTSIITNAFDVRSVLFGQVSLAAVTLCVFREAMMIAKI